MIHHTPKIDPQIIHELIRDAERRHQHKLCITDFDFLTTAVATFIKHSIEKFVAGSKEHYQEGQDFVNGTDHHREQGKEIIDLWMYNLAEQQKHKKHHE